jgi:hypothetical protein
MQLVLFFVSQNPYFQSRSRSWDIALKIRSTSSLIYWFVNKHLLSNTEHNFALYILKDEVGLPLFLLYHLAGEIPSANLTCLNLSYL